MTTDTYRLASTTWGPEEIEAIERVVATGIYTMGEHVAEYEKRFASYFGTNYAVMASSGSASNLLMVAALFFTKNKKFRLERGDEVVVPAVGWSTTFFPLQQYGLRLKFVDIDRQTLNFDLDKLRDSITSKTRAILAVNLLGNSNDFNVIREIADNNNLFILEDNCESMGAEYGNRYTGTFGLMGTFSSFFSHHISTMEGGCIVTDDEELYQIILCLRAHGWTRNLPENNHVIGQKKADPFYESFRFVLPGYNARPLEFSGAVGIEQLAKLNSFVEARRVNGLLFQELFEHHPYLEIQLELGKSSWFGFSLLLKEDTTITRDELVRRLKAASIECRPIVSGNFVKNEVIQYFQYEVAGDLENAEYVDQHGLFVGNHHFDISDQITRLRKLLS